MYILPAATTGRVARSSASATGASSNSPTATWPEASITRRTHSRPDMSPAMSLGTSPNTSSGSFTPEPPTFTPDMSPEPLPQMSPALRVNPEGGREEG